MLYSKAASVLRNVVPRTQYETINRIRVNPFSTEAQKPTETVVAMPDKLYKKIEVEVRGNDPAVLKSYGEFTTMAADKLGVTVGRNFCPRKAKHERLTLLKSVFIYKKHRVQYETRTYYRFIDLLRLTGSTADTILEYLQRNLPEGVAMKVTKVELLPLLESVKVPPTTTAQSPTTA